MTDEEAIKAAQAILQSKGDAERDISHDQYADKIAKKLIEVLSKVRQLEEQVRDLKVRNNPNV